MDDTKIKRLKETDWAVGDAGDFLHLDTDESEFVELKLNVARSIRALRESRSMTRAQFARAIGSRRSTVMSMEAPVALGRKGTLKPGEHVEEDYDMSFMPRENWLSMSIDERTTAEYSDAEIIAHCLDEMTAFSFSPDETARQLEVIRGLVDEIRNPEG